MTDRLLTDGRLLLFKIENRQRGRTLEELLDDGAVKLAKITKRCQSALNFDPLSASNIDPLGVAVSTCRPGAGAGCRGSASADGFAVRL
jgi:hypothetical protein